MALRRGQSLPIPDENSPLPNSPVAASPDRKKTKNVKNLSPLRPSNSAGAAAADGAQVDMFEFPPPTAPTLNRQSVSEYPRNRPPPVNTSIRHRRMFTPIQPLPSEPEPEPQPEPDRGSPFALPSVLNGSYQLPQEPHSHSPKPSPIRPVRPMLTRSQSHALESSSRARKNAAAFVKPEQTQRPPRPQRLRSKETVPDHPQSAAPARQMTAGIEQPQSAPSAAAAAAGHPLLKRDGSHAHTIGPGFPLLGGNGQRTPALFAEMLQAKKQKLRRLTSTDEEELVPNEPIPESELQARDAVWAELQALVKDHFLEIENSRLHREKVLGRGKWSAVYRARLDRQHSNDSPMSPRGHQVVAVKEATYDELRYLHKPPLHTVQEFSREIKVLSTLRHPNMPRLHGVVLQPRLSIVLELLDKGSLAQNVRGEGNPALQQQWAFEVSTRQKLGLVYDIASALAAMHEQRTIHRDVKGHNVLLTRDDLGGWHAKLADFGTSVVLEDGETLSDQVGTIGYIAPELYGDRGYSFPADVFSFAVVAWELFAAVAATQQQPSSADARAGGGDEHSVVLFENPLASIPPDQYAQAVEQGVRPELHEVSPRVHCVFLLIHICSLLMYGFGVGVWSSVSA